MTNDEKKLLQAQHRLEEAQARNRVKERKARTRRLIQEGAVLEKVLPQTVGMDLNELENIFVGLQIEYESRGVPVRRGAPLFPAQRAHLLTTRKRAVVWPSATVRSPRGIALSAESARRCLPASTTQQAKPLRCHRLLPAKNCHRQLFAVYGGQRTRDVGRR